MMEHLQERSIGYVLEGCEKVASRYGDLLQEVSSQRRDLLGRNAVSMLLLALQNERRPLDWATRQILPSALLYTLTQVFVEEARWEWEKHGLVPQISTVLGRLGAPMSEATREKVLDASIDVKVATIDLVNDLWGRKIDRTNMDTAYVSMPKWDANEARKITEAMLWAIAILCEMEPNAPFSPEKKRWGILVGAHIFRAARKQTDSEFELDLAEKLLPDAQRLAWLR